MNNYTLEGMPAMVGLMLEKLERIEKEMSDLKAKYESAPTLSDGDDELMNFQEACTFLKVKANTLHRWKRDMTIPFQKIGTKVYFKKSDIVNYNKIEIKKPRGFR